MHSYSRALLTGLLAAGMLMVLGVQPSAAAADPFIGEISIVAFDYAPEGWMLCEGQELNIAQNQALYALLGTRFGGNGQTTFKLPDLRSIVFKVGDKVLPIKYIIAVQGIFPPRP